MPHVLFADFKVQKCLQGNWSFLLEKKIVVYIIRLEMDQQMDLEHSLRKLFHGHFSNEITLLSMYVSIRRNEFWLTSQNLFIISRCVLAWRARIPISFFGFSAILKFFHNVWEIFIRLETLPITVSNAGKTVS